MAYELSGCVWFGVNPVGLDLHLGGPRGTGKDVARIVALYADLDVKPGGCPDLDTAWVIIGEVSDVLGTRPVAIIHSGHGLQPIWRTDLDPKIDVALLRQHGRLVRSIAADHGTKVDSVFDLARVLRVPGTTSHKYPDAPVATSVTFDDGVAQCAGRLWSPRHDPGPRQCRDQLIGEPPPVGCGHPAAESDAGRRDQNVRRVGNQRLGVAVQFVVVG